MVFGFRKKKEKIMTVKNKNLKNYKTIINTKELPEKESEVLFEFVEFLKKKIAEEKKIKKGFKPKVKFQNWPLKSKNKLTREKIYEYL